MLHQNRVQHSAISGCSAKNAHARECHDAHSFFGNVCSSCDDDEIAVEIKSDMSRPRVGATGDNKFPKRNNSRNEMRKKRRILCRPPWPRGRTTSSVLTLFEADAFFPRPSSDRFNPAIRPIFQPGNHDEERAGASQIRTRGTRPARARGGSERSNSRSLCVQPQINAARVLETEFPSCPSYYGI